VLFRYQLFSQQAASLSLGGRWSRPRPVVPFSVPGPKDTWVDMGLLDTGSDETILPMDAARYIGLDLSQAPTGATAGLGSVLLPLQYAEVKLRLSDGKENREWMAWVGFTTVRIKRPILGFAGVLQFFTTSFHGDREEVFLEVNALYRGS
jgi:predicted aspartyl protease